VLQGVADICFMCVRAVMLLISLMKRLQWGLGLMTICYGSMLTVAHCSGWRDLCIRGSASA
jgi:hypothetical protein